MKSLDLSCSAGQNAFVAEQFLRALAGKDASVTKAHAPLLRCCSAQENKPHTDYKNHFPLRKVAASAPDGVLDSCDLVPALGGSGRGKPWVRL